MEQLTPLLFNYLEENARPHVQVRVAEEIDDTKVNLKRDLPGTIMDYIKGVGEHAEQSNAFIAQIANHLGDDFIDTVRSITETTVEIASEGMDLLLTNGVMNVAKGVIGKTTDEEGGNSSGFNFDFLQSGKEGMVSTTMVLSSPVIKQVSANITKKIAAHIPAKVGGSIQEWIDEHGGSGSLLGKAAGFVAGFLNDDDEDEKKTVAQGGTERDIQETGGHVGKIQLAIQKYLGPKVLSMILPYMQRFEEKMHGSLEGELRGKVFSVEYIKSKVLGMLTGGGDGASPFGAILGAFMGKAGGGGGGEDEDDEGGSGGGMKSLLMGAVMSKVAGGGGGGGEDEDDEGGSGGGMKNLLMGAVMSKVAGGGGGRGGDDDEDDEGGSGGSGGGAAILGALMSQVGGAKGGDDEEEGSNPLGAFAGIASQFMSQREN
ncbi:hypothetical protein BGZ74_008098 [Mortierella antarctica]|nr:hypothetical protein BGZ74_008098 [Mortierella antarctica]